MVENKKDKKKKIFCSQIKQFSEPMHELLRETNEWRVHRGTETDAMNLH